MSVVLVRTLSTEEDSIRASEVFSHSPSVLFKTFVDCLVVGGGADDALGFSANLLLSTLGYSAVGEGLGGGEEPLELKEHKYFTSWIIPLSGLAISIVA